MVTKTLKIPKYDLHRQGRLNLKAKARNLFAFIGREHYEFTAVSMSRYLGVSGSAVSKMISKCILDQSKYSIADIISKDTFIIKPVASTIPI
jgi:hypothetical protein